MQPSVRVVVVNYDGGEVTRRCIDALLATEHPADRLEIVVVDNASVDGLNWVLKEHYPQGAMTDNMVIYLIGAIYYRLGETEKATQYLSRIIGDQNLRVMDPKIYDHARDLWQEIREKKDAAGA